MANTPFQVPQPEAIGGLNSIMVYGENLQVAVGLNHQLAVGNNLQLCVNPSVLEELLSIPPSPTFAAYCGAGAGGNMQFTIGASANVVWGRTFNIVVGPEPVNVNFNDRHPLARGFCMLISAAVLAHIILYGLIQDDNQRATEVIIFQVLVDLLLAGFMQANLINKTFNMSTWRAIQELFKAVPKDISDNLENLRGFVEYAAMLSAFILPVVAIALEEGHFQGDTQDVATS
jgi:hypothetical protein